MPKISEYKATFIMVTNTLHISELVSTNVNYGLHIFTLYSNTK